MSFLERKSTEWTWSEKEQTLSIIDRDQYIIWWLPALLFIPAIIQLIYGIYFSKWIEVALASIVVIPGTILYLIGLKTISLKRYIAFQEIDLIVVKNNTINVVSIKLCNGRYRQLYFTKRADYNEFIEFAESKNIKIKERSLYWSLPLNY
ncbi:hypothetical protein SAMN05192588_0453 [Nonlabens sp. Hel1_33_55]|uniref:hypothetical protein n=1 Tax=Nonlabens sp. Hel1_33_55 TaxID=1336802 RepID=UPI000875B937|nr:hypothetical protein [Nonlabens sp. Hel1_33_55]SCX96206.1 hypothetical protein SAMN05192588_0453 [Nonlabens sp. Hel1_33_55]